jgi:opacity protein-like surface antigen
MDTMKIKKTTCLKLISSLLLLYFSLPAQAQLSDLPNGLYFGIFGGGGRAVNAHATQRATVFFDASQGGTLVVNARGNSNNPSAGFGGVHLGLRGNPWSLTGSGICLIPAIEAEAFYLRSNPNFEVIDRTSRIPNHTFDDSLPMRTGVLLANAVLGFKLPNVCRVYPYIGAGLGGSRTRISDADSPQVNPPEASVNHFNSNPNASANAFAAQAKAGINFDLTCHLKLLVEYRYLYLASSDYTFGSTQYPTHAQTTNWNVHIGKRGYNLGDIGLEYAF